MQLETERCSPVAAVVRLAGELDLSNCDQLRQSVVGLLESGCRALVVNLNGITFIDSSGVGVLVGGLKRVRERDGRYALVCTAAQVLRVFEITGLTRVFEIHDDEESAVRAVGGDEQ